MSVNQGDAMYSRKYKTAAIIAEYNPFHNGHKFQIEETRKITGADFIVSIMSGDFVQRGVPAIFDKYTRTKFALENGADLVIELPVIYALSSAEGFAKGAVNILNKLNCIDYLSFGSESGDLDLLKSIANMRNNISSEDDLRIKELLKTGLSYPSALNQVLQYDTDIISSPNNILAIEYLRALECEASTIIPMTVKRSDNGYSNECFSSSDKNISATALRKLIFDNDITYGNYLPYELSENIIENAVKIDDFSSVLYYKLLSEVSEGYTKYLDVDNNLSGRIVNSLKDFSSISSFIDLLKTKNYTYTRICRALFHILLNIYTDDFTCEASYARVLGFKKSAATLMHDIKGNSELSLITKLSDAPKCQMLKKDIFASSIYENINGRHRNEYRMSPIIVD